jgi:hypothetical protein
MDVAMSVDRIEFLVEEPSMEEALRAFIPKILGTLEFEIYRHQGKKDLLDRLPNRLRGYASWIPATWRVVVIVDQDDEACRTLKARLEELAADAGLVTRSIAKKCTVVNRIAIEELEAWYFGDWKAVRAAYPGVPEGVCNAAKYRSSDAIKGGTWEAFERVLQAAGYFPGGLPKIEAARAIGKHMDPARNTSPSFGALRDSLAEMAV